jgi:hypothetical protein
MALNAPILNSLFHIVVLHPDREALHFKPAHAFMIQKQAICRTCNAAKKPMSIIV